MLNVLFSLIFTVCWSYSRCENLHYGGGGGATGCGRERGVAPLLALASSAEFCRHASLWWCDHQRELDRHSLPLFQTVNPSSCKLDERWIHLKSIIWCRCSPECSCGFPPGSLMEIFLPPPIGKLLLGVNVSMGSCMGLSNTLVFT